MKRILYLDNFRGFKDTFIHFKQVNFFVGENSTGKTSVLSIIDLLSDMKFWFQEDFNTGEINLGNFSDLVSINSKDRTYFYLGFFLQYNNRKCVFRLIKFENKEGRPYATMIVISEEGIIYRTERKGKSIFYDKNLSVSKVGLKSFYYIIENRHQGMSKPEEIKMGDKIRNYPFLLYSASFVLDKISNKKKVSRLGLTGLLADNPIWLAPIRTKPKRTYDEPVRNFTADGQHTPFLVKKQLSTKDSAERFKKLLNEVGSKGNLFKNVKIKSFGKDSSSPFQLQIILDRKAIGIHNVGYGVSQSLPVIVELLCHQKYNSFIIQQPEVHLHPKAQAAMGELFYLLASEGESLFFIETHSDYVIDRFRMKLRDADIKVDTQVLFFDRTKGYNQVSKIEIDSSGDYSENQPREFREFFILEELAKMGL